MFPSKISLHPAASHDFDYIYGLCESTMRGYVEAAFGDRFISIAHPILMSLVTRGLFCLIYANGKRVGALAFERHETHYQLEEIYVEPANQNRGIGKAVVAMIVTEALAQEKPVRLQMLASNRAHTFYAREGFRITRVTPQVIYWERTR